MVRTWTKGECMAPDPKEIALQAEAIYKGCCAVLADHHPGAQGAALAELLAMWINGHAPELRAGLLSVHFEAVLERVESPGVTPSDPSRVRNGSGKP